MAFAANVLVSQVLVECIAEYQHGIHGYMRPFLNMADPVQRLDLYTGYEDGPTNMLFSQLDVAMKACYRARGRTRLLKLLARLPQMQTRVIAHALWSGNLSALTLLPVEMLRKVKPHVVDLGALRGDTSVLKYLHEVVGLDVSTDRAMFYAAQSGQLDAIRYLVQVNSRTNVRWAVMAAARNGHLEAIEFFHRHCDTNLEKAFLAAIQREDLVVAEFILDLIGKDKLDGPTAMESAATYGCVSSLEWLCQRGFDCTTDAMDFAAIYGHLAAVQWLHVNRSEGCTKAAMHLAAINGHLKIVEWLFFHRHEGCMADTLVTATSYEHWEVVRFLVTHGDGTDNMALTTALKNKHIPADIVALLESAAMECRRHNMKTLLQAP